MVWEEVETSQKQVYFDIQRQEWKPLGHTEWNWRYLTHLSQKCVTSSQELKCSCGGKHSCRLSLLQQMGRGQGGCYKASSGAVQPKGEGPVASFCSRNFPPTLCTEHGWLKALVQEGSSVKTQTVATPKCPDQAGRATSCSWKQPDEGWCRSHICTVQKIWRATLHSSKSVTSNSLSRFMYRWLLTTSSGRGGSSSRALQ